MTMSYGVALVVGQLVGLVASVWFLLAHRPRQWRRLEALDAMSFPALVAVVFARSLILTLISWPMHARSGGSLVFSLATLALVDVGMVVKLVNFRRFVRRDGRPIDPPSL